MKHALRLLLRPGAVASLLLTGACGAQVAPPPSVPAWPSISGLAEIAPYTFVVVHDSKPDTGEPAMGFVSIAKDAATMTYAPTTLDVQPPPNDLEAIDAMPGSPTTVIALESGGAADTSRRAFLFQVTIDGAAPTRLLAAPIDIRGVTSAMTNVEALTIESGDAAAKRATVLLANRSPVSDGTINVTIARVALDFASGHAESLGTACTFAFTRPESLGPKKSEWRACADMAIDRDGTLVVAAATDAGSRGPFASVIYRVNLSKAKTDEITRIDGFKVEGLALSNDKKRAWIGTDDEALGGTLRPLAAVAR